MKVGMRYRLSGYGNPRLDCRTHISIDLHRVSSYELSPAILEFADVHHMRIVETRMNDRKNESPTRSKQLRQGAHERIDLRHIEQRHIANRRVKTALSQAQ